jgi:hypothetical protein
MRKNLLVNLRVAPTIRAGVHALEGVDLARVEARDIARGPEKGPTAVAVRAASSVPCAQTVQLNWLSRSGSPCLVAVRPL